MQNTQWKGRHRFWRVPVRLLALTILTLFATSLVVSGQVATGSLSGTVYDTTGAVVPNAQIEMRNEATGVARQTVANSVGFFNFIAVQPGSYTVAISVPGFKTWVQKNIVFNQAENRTFPDIALSAGAQNETVEVSADVTAVPLDTPESRMTLDAQMITQMAIQGRNASELIKVMPGMGFNRGLDNSAWNSQTTQTNSGPIGQYSASGNQPYGSITMTSDGASILDIGNMGTQVANINQDQTAEVTILNSTFGAEFAKGPVTFQALSKSGEKNFHGSGYFYARHSVFNSEDAYLRSQKIAKPEDSYYYPGFTFGGPVLIPGTSFNRNRDKLFFFTGFEYMKQTPPGTLYQSIVPTPAMLSGDFSAASVAGLAGDTGRVPCDASLSGNWWYGSYCGSTGNQFVNGVYAGTLDPNSLALAQLLPKPNQDPAAHAGFNYSILDSTPVNRWEYKLKLDYNINQKTRLSGSYTRQSEGNTNRFGVWWWPGGTVPYPTTLTATTLSRILSANLTHTFNPTMTNELLFAYSFFTFPPKFSNASAVDPANVSGYTDSKIWSPNIIPQIPNMVSWSCNWGGNVGCFPHLYAPGMTESFNGGGFGNRKSVPSIADNFTKVLNKHTLKFGFYTDVSAQAQTSAYGSWGQGMYIFDNWTGNSTGNYLADLVIGHGQYTQTQEVPIVDIRYRTTSFYAQDQWKVMRKLTLTGGLRFDHLGQWYPTGNHPGFAVWDASQYSDSSTASPYSGMAWHATDKNIPISGWESKWSISPRVGAAFDVFGNGKTVLRGGFGIYPWQVTTNDVGGTYLVPLGFRTVTTGALTHLTDVNSYTPGNLGAFNGDSSFALKKGDNKIPYTQNWNFIISQQLPGRSTLELQYAGNRTRDALLTGNGDNRNFIQNVNKIPLGALWATTDPVTGEACRQLNPDGTCNGQSWANWPDVTADFRPYHNYGKALIEVTHGSYSNYHALMASWQKQTGMVTFNANYTFSKVLGIRDGQTNNGNGDGSTVNPFNARSNYGVLAYDHTHIFNASYVVDLPKPMHDNPFLEGVVNGWQVAGITQLQSGPPLQPNTAGNFYASLPVSVYTILGTDQAGVVMPLLTCDPRNGLASGQYFNPNCFAVPTTPGVNGPYTWPYIRGPAYVSSDLSVYKNFKMTERQNLQFRVSAFNFVNHPLGQFQKTDDTTMRFREIAEQPGQYEQYNTNFTGKPAYEVGRRVFEFALKYTF
ncbi:MAG: TonB-dependent receptor [Acidobacteriia bacterium]|nr:TonB-dependent receptor [Terriglobia bacterium]